jgi:hypothetical protein
MSPVLAARTLLLCSIPAALFAACGEGSSQTCTVNGDCASGFCKADGTCGPAVVDGGLELDGATNDAVSPLCTPNHDGTISMAELPLAPGRMATFRIATNATWSTAGQAQTSGLRRWDLSGALASDADRVLALVAPDGDWWQPAFPSATYATQLASTSELRGVFEVATTQLALVGVVSLDGGTYKTELEYDPPAQILKVPMQSGSTWTSTSTVSGYAGGAIVAYTERYESMVDHVGTMATPYGEFPVLRVVTEMTRTSGFTTLASSRTYTWIAECFGPVATATSKNFPTSGEQSELAEVRRLAP